MFSFLKNHPFAVEAYFEHSLVLTFAVPKEQLAALLPPCLSLDTYQDRWAFLAVALVQTKGLRPKGFPKFVGNNFFLIGYRIFVRYTNQAGKNLRGLYILKSETNKRKMELLGNIFTHYNYTTTDINYRKLHQQTLISSQQSGLSVVVEDSTEAQPLPTGSPFPDWKTARRFAGPLPCTFTYLSDTQEVLSIEGVRQNWTPRPLKVVKHNFDFLKSLNLTNAVLANAFIISDIPYYWKKGKLEAWQA